jgi:predicted DNA-binding transcriptional regulator AlpA
MRTDASVAYNDPALAAVLRETAAATAQTVLAELRRHPVVHPEWLSLQDAAAYTGYSEQQFSDFVKRGIAPKSVLFSRNARRFKRSDLDAWCAAGGPSTYASKGEPGAVRR